jgi:hypothetical protein
MRPLKELINEDDSAWPLVKEWIANSKVDVSILECALSIREKALIDTQVTTRSPMGAIVHQCAGLLIDFGWLRILGAGGHDRFQRSLPDWNRDRANGFYLVADDAVGGFFAINGGALGDDIRTVYYFAPDSLRWESCKMGYTDFLTWAMSERLNQFYESIRWPMWKDELKSISADQVIGIYPFLFTTGVPIMERHRGIVPVSEQYSLQFDLKKQLDGE